jgi:FkbM family methyltransferase
MRFYGQHNPPVDKILYDSYFKNQNKGFFIEAGACDGILESSCKFFEEFLGWKGINIEPDPYLYKRLCINRPDSKNINVALSSKNGISSFTHVIHPNRKHIFGNGSLQHKSSHKASLDRINCKYEEFIVKTITYHTLLAKESIECIDLFVLDVEGHELEVLKTLTGAKVLPKIFCIEHTMHDLELLSGMMKDLGYVLDQQVNNNSYFIL